MSLDTEFYRLPRDPHVTTRSVTRERRLLSDREEFATTVGLPLTTLDAAAENVTSGKAGIFVVAGKMCAGKDTVAPLIVDRMGWEDAARVAYSTAVREEADALLVAARTTPGLVSDVIADRWPEVPATHYGTLARLLTVLAADPNVVDAGSRTPEMRELLQYWALEVRRVQDPDYWIVQATRTMVSLLADGTSVYVTDARFPNDVWAAQDVGAIAVRLDVGPEQQAARLIARDGHAHGLAHTRHGTETALDGFADYDIIVNTDELSPEQVADRVANVMRVLV